MPKHEQVEFMTLQGESTQVDVGMVTVLEELRRLGVDTKFSCQKEFLGVGYVLGTSKTFEPLLKRIQKNAWRGTHYSLESMTTAARLLESRRRYDFTLSRDRSRDQFLSLHFTRGGRKTGWRIERDFSNAYGRRTVLRWPVAEHERLLQLLRETR